MKELNPYQFPEPAHPNREIVPEGQRLCPICGDRMIPKRKEGITIDTCEEHGVWLDKNELPRIIYRIKYKGRMNYERELKRAKKEYKMHGICLGWLSLLFD